MDHLLRAIRVLVDAALKDLSRDFGRLYGQHEELHAERKRNRVTP
ncbi:MULTISPECIES: hypothetical protein [unclassified Bradyrhizobium]|nr:MULTISPECIES: hypothetical protein [unclassified Bradyrhizobium]